MYIGQVYMSVKECGCGLISMGVYRHRHSAYEGMDACIVSNILQKS